MQPEPLDPNGSGRRLPPTFSLRCRRQALILILAAAVNLVIFALVPAMIGQSRGTSEFEKIASVSLREIRPEELQPDPQEISPEPPPEEPPPPEPPAPTAMRTPSPEMPTMPAFTPDLALSAAGTPMVMAPPPARTAFEFGEVDRTPMTVYRTPPPYPYRAKRMRIEGVVKVRFLVGTDGRTSRIQILSAEPEGIFEESVLRTIEGWRFEPGKKDGRKVATWVVTPVRFQLENS